MVRLNRRPLATDATSISCYVFSLSLSLSLSFSLSRSLPHNSTFNFGYGYDASHAGMTSSTVLVTSAAIELLFEGVVDALALNIETQNGIDLEQFWIL